MEPEWVDPEWSWPCRWVDVPGGRLRTVDVGSGPTVLFAHGTPTWSYEWRHLLTALAPTHRCIAPDHLGFGRSERPTGADYSPEAHAARFRALAEALDLRDVTLVVHDFGGPIGLPLALGTDRVARVVIVNTWMWPLDDDPGMAWGARLIGSPVGRWLYGWANLSLRVIAPSAYGDRAKLTLAIHAQYLAPFTDRAARTEVLWPLARALLGSSAHYASLWDRRARLAALPTTLVWGLADSAFPPRFLARWREALPQAAVTAIEGAGHWPHEEEPERVIAAIRAALA
ncbi:MAG: alpha/beta fold hydrolase [Myxococcota bacterium]